MDLYCPKCREPWDNDCLHDEAKARGHDCDGLNPASPCADGCVAYRKVAAEFRRQGCAALSTAYPNTSCEARGGRRDALADAVYDLMGDDMDGAAAAFEDAEYLGLL